MSHSSRANKDARTSLSNDRALLHGLICGDGYFHYDRSKAIYEVGLLSRSREIAELFAKVLTAVFAVKPPRIEHTAVGYKVRLRNKAVYKDLRTYCKRESSSNWKFPREHLRGRSLICWLKGYMSTDGTVYLLDGKKPRVSFGSTNPKALWSIQSALAEELGINAKVYERRVDTRQDSRRLPIYTLEIIRKADVREFIKVVGSFKEKHKEVFSKALSKLGVLQRRASLRGHPENQQLRS